MANFYAIAMMHEDLAVDVARDDAFLACLEPSELTRTKCGAIDANKERRPGYTHDRPTVYE